MTVLKLDINRRDYEVVCNDGEEEHITQLSFELDRRVQAISKLAGTANQTTLLMMAGLQLAEELQQAKSGGTGANNAAFEANILRQVADKVEEIIENIAKKAG